MAQNYNLNSNFGFNVTGGANKTSNAKPEVELSKNAPNLFDSMTSYLDKYENVFTGDVANEIGMYSRQAMIVGMNLKAADNNIRRFDVSI